MVIAIGKGSKRAFLDKLRFRRFGTPAIESGFGLSTCQETVAEGCFNLPI